MLTCGKAFAVAQAAANCGQIERNFEVGVSGTKFRDGIWWLCERDGDQEMSLDLFTSHPAEIFQTTRLKPEAHEISSRR